MHSVIVVPPSYGDPENRTADQIRISSGERLAFGRAAQDGGGLAIAHEGVPRIAGEITAHQRFWLLSNFSENQTYVVENPEGAGEHIKVAPGRLDAPVSFEFSRVVLPAAGDLLSFDVWAPDHAFRSVDRHGLAGTLTAPSFALDRTKRYFAVLAALCEPRLRGEPHAPLPCVEELVERLRPVWPWGQPLRGLLEHRLPVREAAPAPRPGHGGTGQAHQRQEGVLGLLALRFDLVHEGDLVVLAPAVSEVDR